MSLHKVDEIQEHTANAGVTVENVLLKDGVVGTDSIAEKTANAGVTIDGILTKDGYWELTEQAADPAAPAANKAILYTKDNGAGKTQLAVRFATGAVQIIATEP